jgi:thioredoxin 1
MGEFVASVNDQDFQSQVLDASKSQPVMVDFWAEWCGPCRVLAPTVDQIAREQAGKLKVVKMNVDESPNTPTNYRVRGIPTLLIFKGGQVADQVVGAVPKDQIDKVLARHIG